MMSLDAAAPGAAVRMSVQSWSRSNYVTGRIQCLYISAHIRVWTPAASMWKTSWSSWCSACCALRKERSPSLNWNATRMRIQRTGRIMEASHYLEAGNLPFYCGSFRVYMQRVIISSTEVSQSLEETLVMVKQIALSHFTCFNTWQDVRIWCLAINNNKAMPET